VPSLLPWFDYLDTYSCICKTSIIYINITQHISQVIVYINKRNLIFLKKRINASQSSFVKCLSKSCICCLWLLERFLKFVNYNAYTIIAIEGKSFCVSAQKAFVLIIENSMRIAVVNSVGDFFLFLSKLIVTALTLLVALFILDVPFDQPGVNIVFRYRYRRIILNITDLKKNYLFKFDQYKFFILPLLIVIIISFLIAHSFFTVYEVFFLF
jgi:solute carrier family 44 protein 1 (choline transporter-like protein)